MISLPNYCSASEQHCSISGYLIESHHFLAAVEAGSAYWAFTTTEKHFDNIMTFV